MGAGISSFAASSSSGPSGDMIRSSAVVRTSPTSMSARYLHGVRGGEGGWGGGGGGGGVRGWGGMQCSVTRGTRTPTLPPPPSALARLCPVLSWGASRQPPTHPHAHPLPANTKARSPVPRLLLGVHGVKVKGPLLGGLRGVGLHVAILHLKAGILGFRVRVRGGGEGVECGWCACVCAGWVDEAEASAAAPPTTLHPAPSRW